MVMIEKVFVNQLEISLANFIPTLNSEEPEVFKNDQLKAFDEILNKKYLDDKYNKNLILLFSGLALHLGGNMTDYIEFLRYIKFDFDPEKLKSPENIAKLLSSIIRDERKSKMIEALLTFQLSMQLK